MKIYVFNQISENIGNCRGTTKDHSQLDYDPGKKIYRILKYI